MPSKKAVDEGVAGEEAVAEKPVSKKHTSAAVHTDQGAHIRTYTHEDHGTDFHDNAKEFAAHTPGSQIVLS